MTNLEKITNRLNLETAESLKKMIKLLMNDFRDGADIVFDIAYEALRNKTDEQDFIQFNNIIYLYH